MRVLVLVLALILASSAGAQIRHLGEMSAEEIRALDRARTVVLMPGGVLEQHGPYLPSFTDGFMNEWWTREIAEAIAARPGWQVVIFPMLPLGHGGANEIGGIHSFPGSYGVRAETLRAVYMDLAAQFGEQRFRWLFIMQNHGSPLHNLVIDQASDFFRDSYGGTMVNLPGLEPADSDPPPKHPFAKENGVFDIHAGLSETSRLMFLRPDLVPATVRTAQSLPAYEPERIGGIARIDGWPGYFGSPRHATAAYGAALMRQRANNYIRAALQILDGKDVKTIPRFSTSAVVEEKEIVADVLRHDAALREKQRAWMTKNGIE